MVRICSVIVGALVLVAGCAPSTGDPTTGDPSSATTGASARTSTPATAPSTSGTSSAPGSSPADQGIAPCRGLESVDPFSYAQFSVPTPSSWEVTYAVLANGCDRPVTLRVAAAGRSEGAAVTAVHLLRPVDRAVQATRRLGGTLRGRAGPVEVAPGERIQVVAAVRAGSMSQPTRLPPVRATSTIDGRSTTGMLRAPVTMCSCARPPSS